MSRDPFNMIGSCPVIPGITLDVLPGYFSRSLFCSTPPFTTPTCIIPPRGFNPPDIAPPVDCLCLDIDINTVVTITSDLSLPRFTGHYTNLTSDCCDPHPRLDLDLQLPCMPFDVTGSGTVTLTSDKTPRISFNPSKADCILDLGMHLQLPCMPFTVTSEDTVVSVVQVPVPYATMSVRLTAEDCALKVKSSIQLGMPADVSSFAYMSSSGDDMSIYGGMISWYGRKVIMIPDGAVVRIISHNILAPSYVSLRVPADPVDWETIANTAWDALTDAQKVLVCTSTPVYDDGTHKYKMLMTAYLDGVGRVVIGKDLRPNFVLGSPI